MNEVDKQSADSQRDRERVRVSLGRSGTTQVHGRRDVVLLGDASAPAGVLEVLEKGPKFANEVMVKPHKLFSLVWNVTARADEADRDRCILEGVESLPAVLGCRKASTYNNMVLSFCKDEGFKLMLTDKEGGFGLVPVGVFSDKAGEAISKNFKKD